MKPALLLVDLQHDFLERYGLTPPPDQLILEAGRILEAFRERRFPVCHVHTVVAADGADRMPHWKREQVEDCIAGRSGTLPPESLRPSGEEPVFTKQFFSGFGARPSLEEALRRQAVDTLVIAGLYLHGCVRSTVLDAYERGFEVWVADDAVGTTEAAHGEITRIYLDGRAARFAPARTLIERFCPQSETKQRYVEAPPSRGARTFVAPAAIIAEATMPGTTLRERRNPASWNEVLAQVGVADPSHVSQAARASAAAQREWQRLALETRLARLSAWADALDRERETWAQRICLEVGKPLREARAECQRASAHIRVTIETFARRPAEASAPNENWSLRSAPHGVVGLITPWNNPLAIPVGKIAPALAAGNGVLWKPAVEAPQTAVKLIESLAALDLPAGLATMVFGDAEVARALIDQPEVAAVSLTGACETGQAALIRTAKWGKPYQAELGGNNAAIVLRDSDPAASAKQIAAAAFSFAGQRCTAIRRVIVERPLAATFRKELVAACERLRLGDPSEAETEIGPLVSRTHQARMEYRVQRAQREGVVLDAGGDLPAEWEHGCWLRPAVLWAPNPSAPFLKQEHFGPLVSVIEADDLAQAIEFANDVPQGLVAAIHTDDRAAQRRFVEAVRAGIVRVGGGALEIAPDAPFGGWKSSRFGPPEHGVWDREFYTLPQAVYGKLGEVAAP